MGNMILVLFVLEATEPLYPAHNLKVFRADFYTLDFRANLQPQGKEGIK